MVFFFRKINNTQKLRKKVDNTYVLLSTKNLQKRANVHFFVIKTSELFYKLQKSKHDKTYS